MLQVDLFRPEALPERDIAAWRAMLDATPEFASPLLGPDFARAVGRVREDAAVAVFRAGDDAVAILPHHRRPGGLARPIGAPFSDVHALVGFPDVRLDPQSALAAAGIGAFRFSGLIDPHGLFAETGATAHESFRIELDRDAGAYLEDIRSASPKKFKNWRRLDNKLEREHGPVVMTGPDHDSRAFELMLYWKRDQLRRSGLHDVYRAPWVQGLMRQLFAERSGPLQGLMVTLKVRGQLVAAHFGVRSGADYHPWIASFDPSMADYSPGQAFLNRAIAAMPDMGLQSYDLSSGHDHYKAPYANRRTRVLEGVAFADGVQRREPLIKAETAQRLGRRLDQIASVELDMPGRLRGVLEAASGWSRREKSRPVPAQTDVEERAA